MSSAAPRRPRTAQKFVAKRPSSTVPPPPSDEGSSVYSSSKSSSAQSSGSKPSHQTLTTSIRGRPPPSKRGGGEDSFVNYLPHDEAVASGLGADAGGLDAEEAQRVVDLLNDQLSRLLKLDPRDFWREVARNDSLHEFLDSYLQFRSRWYDLPHRGARGMVAGVIVGDSELCRRVFMTFYRMSSNKDPGASASNCLSIKEHTALLQEKKLLDLPKLLDICALYGHENGDLTKTLVANALKAQPGLLENIDKVASQFLSILHTMHERCSSSLEVLGSSKDQGYHGHRQLCKDYLEVMEFINDAVATLDAFVEAYQPLAVYLSNSYEMSYGNDDLLTALARVHDFMLPSLHQGFTILSNTLSDNQQNVSGLAVSNNFLSLKMLSVRLVKFGWNLIDLCYLSTEPIEVNVLQSSTKMLPAKVEDPAIRGDILIQTIKDITSEFPYHSELQICSFLHSIQRNYNMLTRIVSLRNIGWIYMDEEQFGYLSQIATPPSSMSLVKDTRSTDFPQREKVQVDEDAIMLESKISQIKDIFPDYGKGFLLACLEVYNQNPEEVIQRILEGTLHDDLQSLDTSLEQVPQKQSRYNKKDKGKGVVMEAAPESSPLPSKMFRKEEIKDTDVPTSTSASSYGRYTRKSTSDKPDTEVLDEKAAKDSVRYAVLAAEHDYEDEYDDSFDELGLNLVESGFEETENLSDRISSLPGKSWDSETGSSSQNSGSRWSSQKKPQFYVKDGKNYSYKVAGSVAVSSAQEAAQFTRTQRGLIHGLGAGGNKPLGTDNKNVDELEDHGQQENDGSENAGRGNAGFRGRGGRRGGNYHRKDRAMKKHFQSLGGF